MAIKNLNSDKNILILSADKGNATVVMNTDDYDQKIKDLLDPMTYKKLNKDPTANILRKTNSIIKRSTIPPDVQRNLTASEALSPRLYGLPKIHKSNVPLRPIVSAINSPTYKIAKYLAAQLQPYIGKTDSYIKDSAHFVEKLSSLSCQPSDILVSFDVVSLFTMVPINDALNRIADIFPDDITGLFKHCLTTTYFQYNHEFYEQLDGVAMGSPISPVIANFYMEYFEEKALNTAAKKPSCWFRYMDDTFTIWSHGHEELDKFLQHINSINPKIQFTMEKEVDGKISFLDVLVSRKSDGKLDHQVYRKPTHTDRYLHFQSNHHPKQKRGVIKTLIDRAKHICNQPHLNSELKHVQSALLANGYNAKDIQRAIHPRRDSNHRNNKNEMEEQKGKAFLPYIKSVTDRIGKILQKHQIKSIYLPTQKIKQLTRSPKDAVDNLEKAGVYKIPCSCGEVYIGTTKRSFNTRIKEHKRCCRLNQIDKSAVAEHAILNDNHHILFDETKILSTTKSYYARLNREAIEIFKHKRNFNKKEEGLRINKTWIPALQNKIVFDTPQQNQTHTNPDSNTPTARVPHYNLRQRGRRGDDVS